MTSSRRFFKMKKLRLVPLLVFLFLQFTLAAQTDEPGEPGRLVLSFTGDLMAHSINYKMDDYEKIYHHVASVFQNDDLSFTNAEFPMDPGKPMASFPNFNIHPVYLEAFVNAGLDVFSMANNHMGDIGENSMIASFHAARELVEKTEATLHRKLYFSGLSDTPSDDYSITEIEKNGWKIGFLAVSQKSNNPADPRLLYQIDYLKQEQREPFLTWISEKSADYDLFILSYHGGVEYNFIPGNGKRDFFRSLIGAGVDIVWAHHPHVLQEVEIVDLEDRGQGLILYSLGNFLSGQGRIIDEVLPEEEWSYTGDSAIIQVIIDPETSKAAPRAMVPQISEVHPIPTANYINPNREVIIYPLAELVVHPLPSPWDDFYRERNRIMNGYFLENIKTWFYSPLL